MGFTINVEKASAYIALGHELCERDPVTVTVRDDKPLVVFQFTGDGRDGRFPREKILEWLAKPDAISSLDDAIPEPLRELWHAALAQALESGAKHACALLNLAATAPMFAAISDDRGGMLFVNQSATNEEIAFLAKL